MAKRRTPIRSSKLKNRKPVHKYKNKRIQKSNVKKIKTLKTTKTSISPGIKPGHPMFGNNINMGSNAVMGGGPGGGGGNLGTAENNATNHGPTGDDVDAGGYWLQIGTVLIGTDQTCTCDTPELLYEHSLILGFTPLWVSQTGFNCYYTEIVGNPTVGWSTNQIDLGHCQWSETGTLAGGGPMTRQVMGGCGTKTVHCTDNAIEECVNGDWSNGYPPGLTESECENGTVIPAGYNPVSGQNFESYWFEGCEQGHLSMYSCTLSNPPGSSHDQETSIRNQGHMTPDQCCGMLEAAPPNLDFQGIGSYYEMCSPNQNGESLWPGQAYWGVKCWYWYSEPGTAGGTGRGGH